MGCAAGVGPALAPQHCLARSEEMLSKLKSDENDIWVTGLNLTSMANGFKIAYGEHISVISSDDQGQVNCIFQLKHDESWRGIVKS